jgi:HEAT repeat protein
LKKDFMPGRMRGTREGALDGLAAIPDAEVLAAFEWALGITRARVAELSGLKDELTEELSRLEKQLDDTVMRETERARKEGRPPGPVSVPLGLKEAIEDRRAQVEARQAEIDEEYALRDSASTCLGRWLGSLDAKERVVALREFEKRKLPDKDHVVRLFFLKALRGLSLPEAVRLVLGRLAAEDDVRVLPVAADVAAELGETAVVDLLARLADTRWTVRVAVVAALGRIGSAAAVQPLIDLLRTEDGRLRGDIAAALAEITGQDLGPDADRWQTWWEAHKDSFVPGGAKKPEAAGGGPGAAPPAAGAETVSFYGIRIDSKKVVFVIDVSNSMNQEAGAGRTKVQVAKYELRNAILGLPDDARFAIVFYHHEVFRWKPAMVEAKGGARKQAVEFVEAMVADGNTNIYDALKLAFTYAGMGARDKHYDIGADTIFFLSDGQPNRGAVTATAAILAEVARWNELKRVKIHAVGVGKDHDAAFMRSLAESSGGTYVNR